MRMSLALEKYVYICNLKTILITMKIQVFVEFSSAEEAEAASKAIAGRMFDQRLLLTAFYPTDKYHNREYA